MEASCHLPVVSDWCGASADRFNISWQQTWGFGLWFLRGDHKAVKRLERPRSAAAAGCGEMADYCNITERYDFRSGAAV
jgi:hypothetical protein